MQLCDDWCTTADVLDADGPCCGDDPPDEAKVAMAIPLVSGILWGLTGERFGGLCEQTVRPCSRYSDGTPAWPKLPSSYPAEGWSWQSSWGTCGCQLGRACGCSRLSEITLGAYPIQEVTEVTIDGAVVPASSYRVDEQRWLVRIDGDSWPCCQDLAAPLTADDTFGVTVLWGEPIPEAGTVAAAIYACQIARAWCGQECELPSRVQSITRQGVTASFADPTLLITNGLTGVALVDTWIRAVNGGSRPPSPLLISSPDVPRRLRGGSNDPAGS